MMTVSSLVSIIIDCLIMIYQCCISPIIQPSCRFTPSCSHYARTSIKNHGPIKGLWLVIKRVAKCHPWHNGGYDPVPDMLPQNEKHKM